MKTNRFRFINPIFRVLLLVSFVMILAQCRGPRGQNGIDGINYTHSAIYDVTADSWTGDTNGYQVLLSVPEITDDIYYNGAVLVYRLIEVSPKSFNMLPYTYLDNNYAVYLDYDVYVGSINLLFKEVIDGINNTLAPESTMSFKVVIIEGLSLSGLKNYVDPKDYNAVSRLLNLDRAQ